MLQDNVLKLADFGSCRGVNTLQPYTEYISTRWCVFVYCFSVMCTYVFIKVTVGKNFVCRVCGHRYRAPECLLTDGFYSLKMDIWSFGCVFFEVMR